MPKKKQEEIEWIATPEGKAWLSEALSHRKALGLIIGNWERSDTIDIIDTHALSHWIEEIFRKAHKRYPDKEVSIVLGNWLNFHPDRHDRANISPEDQYLRDQLEIGWIKTGDDRYRAKAEKIGNPIVEWRSLIQ
jgi:hypothetical protein